MKRISHIKNKLLQVAPNIVSEKFTYIAPIDLNCLFKLYDELFFSNELSLALGNKISFSISNKMKKVAGKTIFFSSGKIEIRISNYLLMNNFNDLSKTAIVSGLICNTRLDALMRVFEHELVHVIEFLQKGESNCSKKPFKTMAFNLFGHTHHKHQLIKKQLKPVTENFLIGDEVTFIYKNKHYFGKIHNITKRATVMVTKIKSSNVVCKKTALLKFYVPLCKLKHISS